VGGSDDAAPAVVEVGVGEDDLADRLALVVIVDRSLDAQREHRADAVRGRHRERPAERLSST
jgi:hypothetical protein